MAARTFTTAGVNNLWSNAANWDGGASAPVNNDSVTIPLGQTCEFDADQSGFADGIAGITVTGTLSLTRTAGTYYMKIKAAATIAGAGTFDCGTLASPIPFAAKHTITGGAAWFIQGSGGLAMTVYAAEPSIKYIKLSGLEAIGQTVLSVDTDVTEDIWADGDTIAIIDNVPYDNEVRVIAAGGIAAGTITVTAGLTAAKSSGSYICLMTRNVRFVGNGDHLIKNTTQGKFTLAGGEFYMSTTHNIIYPGVGITVTGGTFRGDMFMRGCLNIAVSGCVVAMCTYALHSSHGVVTGGLFAGNYYSFFQGSGMIVYGGLYVASSIFITSCSGMSVLGGIFEYGSTFITGGAGMKISDVTVRNNSIGLTLSALTITNSSFSGNSGSDNNQSIFTAYNTLFGSTVENINYALLSTPSFSESYDHDQVAGAYKAWTKGGVTTKQAVTYPTGYTAAMQTVLENATAEGFWQKEIVVGAGASVNITSWLRKSASMVYLPRVIVFNKASADPFAGGAGLHTFTMTDTVDTWESDLYTYTNGTAEDVTLVIRTQGMNASGNLFSWVDVEQINVDLTSVIARLTALKGFDAVITAGYTGEELFRILAAVLSGKVSGGGTNTIIFRDVGDTKNVVTATVDTSGNRLNVVLDVT